MALTTSRTSRLLNSRQEHVPRGLAVAHPVVVANAQGATVWDVDGRTYVDFVGGIGVLNVGHNHPRVTQAVRAQLERLSHVSAQVATYEPYVALAERLNAIAPVRAPAKTLLLTTGAEAVENAVKISRAAKKIKTIISFAQSFHGRTLLGMSLTGKARPYRQRFGPYAPEVYHAPFPNPYRGADDDACLAAFDDLLLTQVAADQVAAVVVEPVLGEGGFIPASTRFLSGLRQRADRHGFLLIADEIQSGFGRTGTMFAIEHSGVEPDLVTTAKSLAGGLPLAAVIGSAHLMDAPDPGGLGGTYGGNPLACAAALAVLDVFESEGLLERARRLGQRLRSSLDHLQERFAAIGEVRGLGPMLAIDLVRDPATREPAPELAAALLEAARERGLLLLSAGLHGNVVRFLTPLNIDDDLLEHALAVLEDAMDAVLDTERRQQHAP
ncbi:MAG: 4-aminobutyrate--2-oxoglutarate transaminase [Trueperaceae bacterium]|nr:MAG: 4-aminobutyrate--2-oxoglutarate transaminase [Trueperaceae bacterium]